MRLNEIFGFGEKRPTVLTRAAQEEIQRLLDSVIASAETAMKANAAGDAERFVKNYTGMRRMVHYIDEMLAGRGPKGVR